MLDRPFDLPGRRGTGTGRRGMNRGAGKPANTQSVVLAGLGWVPSGSGALAHGQPATVLLQERASLASPLGLTG